MTTIAWDGKIMAADTQAESADMRFKVKKIFVMDDGLIAGIAGDYAMGLEIVNWLNGECLAPVFNDPDRFTTVLLAGEGRLIRYENSLIPISILDPFHAAGSGRDYAMAAMHMGKSAKEAVQIASVFDIHTGADVDWFGAP